MAELQATEYSATIFDSRCIFPRLTHLSYVPGVYYKLWDIWQVMCPSVWVLH